jgi:hypothetical protein
MEKRDRFKAITLFCSSISIHSFLLEVSSNLLEIPVALFPLSGFWFYGLAKISASTEIDAPQWHFLKKASKQSKARRREDQLYSFGITRQDPGICLRAVIAWTWGTLNCSEPSCMMNSKCLSMWMMTWSLDRRLDKKSSAARGKLLRSADQGCSTLIIINTLKEWICLFFNNLLFGIWIRNLQLRAGNCCGLLIKDVLP